MADSADLDIEQFRQRLADALPSANVPTLLLLLYQFTGQERWLDPPFVPVKSRWDDNDSGGLSPELQEEVRGAALDAIVAWRRGEPIAKPDLTADELIRMMTMSEAEPIPPEHAELMIHKLRRYSGALPEPVPVREGFRALIIGAGMSGVAAAVRLRQLGVPYVIIEKQDAAGGVWHSHHYPGCGVDTPGHLYSYTFAGGDWSKFFPLQDEVEGYFRRVARELGVEAEVRFGTECLVTRYDEESRHVALPPSASRRVGGDAGDGRRHHRRRRLHHAQVAAHPGPARLRRPGPPHLAVGPLGGARRQARGGDRQRRQRHAARARHRRHGGLAHRLPAVQAVGRPLPQVSQAGARAGAPPAPRSPALRVALPAAAELGVRQPGARGASEGPRAGPHPDRSINATNEGHREVFARYIKEQLAGRPDLLGKVTPHYPPFGKRMLLDNGWYKALTKPNVTLIDSQVSRVEGRTVHAAGGEAHDVDVLIVATGYDVTRFLSPVEVVGRGGLSIREAWDDVDLRAYLGTVVPGFPNLFMLYGPNTALGHGGSFIFTVECQIDYVLSLLRQMGAVRAPRGRVPPGRLRPLQRAHPDDALGT